MQAAGEEALLQRHEPLLYWCAHRYRMCSSDGLQILREAFVLAARNFDPSRGSFASLACLYAHHVAHRRYYRSRHIVYMPAHVYRARSLLRRGAPRTRESLKSAFISEHAWEAVQVCGDLEVVPLPELSEDEEPVDDSDSLDDQLAAHEQRRLFMAALVQLDASSPRKAEVLALRCAGLTLLEIGNMWGLTHERVRQLEAEALDWMRAHVVVQERYAG